MALAILDANRDKLLSVDDDGEAMTILSEYLDNITNKEYDSPFKSAASSIRGTSVGGVGSGWWMMIVLVVVMVMVIVMMIVLLP